MDLIERHYRLNRQILLKRLTFRAGTEWDAEDILQEAYCRALKFRHTFDGTNMERWFFTIVRNALRAHKNAEKGIIQAEFDEEAMEGVQCTFITDQTRKEVLDKVAKEGPMSKEILTLYIQYDLDPVSISQVLDISYAAAYKAIVRFQAKLKERYEE